MLVTDSNCKSKLLKIKSKPASGPDALALLVQEPQEHHELTGWWTQHGLKRQAENASILARLRKNLVKTHSCKRSKKEKNTAAVTLSESSYSLTEI